MKRYVFLAGVAALLLLLFVVWPRGCSHITTREVTDIATPGALADTNSSDQADAGIAKPEQRLTDAGSVAVATNQDDEFLQLVRRADEAGNVPVAFYGLVVDQDSNALQNVSVDLGVIDEWSEPFPQGRSKSTPLQRQTGADGRFEISDSSLRGKYVAIYTLTKDGYEQEFPGRASMYGAQSGSFSDPTILRMWNTNIQHEKLITGEVSSAIIPDGRRYSVDLTNATIAEGATGDLVIWLKRPAEVGWTNYDWSCEATANTGGLLEEIGNDTMLIAPVTGYTNVFNYRQEATQSDWKHGLYGKRFYIRLCDGQIYGRITVNLRSSPNRQVPATLRVQYVINPSGSRLLR